MNCKKQLIFSALVFNGLSCAMQGDAESRINNLLGVLAANKLASQLYSSPQITVPSTFIIQTRLGQLGLQDFFNKTDIGNLGGKQKYPNEVAVRVDMNLDRYSSIDPIQSNQAKALRTEIIKAILQDFPLSIVHLQKDGLLEMKP